MAEKREHWSGNLGFILAASGAVIGLGNIWKFPYLAGQNGGGAFVLVYLISILLVGTPIMLCEMTLGRSTQKNPVGAFKMLSPESSRLTDSLGIYLIFIGIVILCFKQFGWAAVLSLSGLLLMFFGWTIIGILSVLVPFFILSYYGVIGGWTLGYVYKSFVQELNVTTVNAAGTIFSDFIRNIWWMISLFTAFMILCALIVSGGVKNGIERWSKILMPLFFALLIVVMLRCLTLPGAVKGVEFFLKPDFTKLTGDGVMEAVAHAFYTLSLGMGIAITYSSYISRQQNIFLSALSIVALNTVVAIFAGLTIFPAVFAMGFAPDHGPNLVFRVLPAIFNSMSSGWLWSGLFYILLCIAALTSAIALLEVMVSYLIDEQKWSRSKAVWICTSGVILLGLLSAVSIANWDNIKWLQYWLVTAFNVKSSSFFDAIVNLCSNWFLPLNGLGISLFVGWIWGTHKAVQEIRHGSNNFADVHLVALLAGLKDDASHNDEHYHILTLASVWGIFIRFVAPAAITIAFIWMNVR